MRVVPWMIFFQDRGDTTFIQLSIGIFIVRNYSIQVKRIP